VPNPKTDVTDSLAVNVTVQAEVPLQNPGLQPENIEPELGVGFRVTELPLLKEALQESGQAIPLGLLLTVPVPCPTTITLSV
jgi:hypothetical protein